MLAVHQGEGVAVLVQQFEPPRSLREVVYEEAGVGAEQLVRRERLAFGGLDQGRQVLQIDRPAGVNALKGGVNTIHPGSRGAVGYIFLS